MKTDIVELLRDCPKGMELGCAMYDKVTLLSVGNSEDTIFPIRVLREDGCVITLTKYGQYADAEFAKCVIFPKGKTTWEGFQRPFEDGDILTYTSNYTTTFIYRNKDNEPNFSTSFYVACNNAPSNRCLIYNKSTLIALNENCDVRLATEDEKKKLFDAIKANCYKWNPETKTLEKLPKFKVGDRIRHVSNSISGIIIKIIDIGYYIERLDGKGISYINFKREKDYELVPNKFDINTLVPFESRVLVRDYDNQIWIPTFFGKYLEDDSNCRYLTTNGCYKYCIPYEANKELLGTTNNPE